MRYLKQSHLIACIFSLLIAGCGGGGDSASSTSTDTYPVRAAWVNYLSDTGSYSFASGQSGPVEVSGILQQSALKAGTFMNATALGKLSVANGTIQINKQATTFTDSETIYVDSNYLPLGVIDNDEGEYAVVSGLVSIPQTARVGESGTIFNANLYASSDQAKLLGTKSLTYAIEPHTANTAFFKLTETDKDLAGTVTDSIVTVFLISPSGSLARISEYEVVEGVGVLVSFVQLF